MKVVVLSGEVPSIQIEVVDDKINLTMGGQTAVLDRYQASLLSLFLMGSTMELSQ